MIFFILGLVCAAAIVPTYIGFAVRDFLRVRREFEAAAGQAQTEGAARELELEAVGATEADARRDTVRFVWQALAGAIVATAMIFIVSHVWWWWYVMPALAFGTGIAVIVAFIVDPTKTSSNV